MATKEGDARLREERSEGEGAAATAAVRRIDDDDAGAEVEGGLALLQQLRETAAAAAPRMPWQGGEREAAGAPLSRRELEGKRAKKKVKRSESSTETALA